MSSTPSLGTDADAPYGSMSNADTPYQLQDRSPSRDDKDEYVERNAEVTMSMDEFMHSTSSYHAMVKPVTVTMILAALAVVFINTPQTISQGEQAMSVYLVWTNDESDSSNGKNLLTSLGNGLVMISVIGAMTFGIVLLYKYRCMKFLIGYMILSSSMLLGVLGGQLFDVAIEKYRLPIDKFSYYFIMYNFGLVGTIAIFYQKGVPMYITQSYLVATSVILAWQLSHFETWTTWSLLVCLALYDLCAVLTPCGPLKALVGLMQQEDAPDMPGLLYEAELPAEARRGRLPNVAAKSRRRAASSASTAPNNGDDAQERDGVELTETNSDESAQLPNNVPPTNQRQNDTVAPSDVGERTVVVPFGIARLYRLTIVPTPPTGDGDDNRTSLLEAGHEANPLTPAQLIKEVEAILPRNGGKIEKRSNGRYAILDREGVIKRVLYMDREGRVFEEVEVDDDDEDDQQFSNSIRLGLGDFIFYSVLVSQAAKYSFTTFIACMLVILAGLGATLVLLSVFKMALPALPISIFLGVTFYLLTRTLIEPWIQDILRQPFYV